MSFGNVSDFRGIPTGPLMGSQPAKTTHAAEGAGQTNLPATGVEGKLSVKQIAALYQSPAPGAPGKAVAGAAKELRNVGKPPDKSTGGADRLVRPKQTAAPVAAAKPLAPVAQSAAPKPAPSVKDIAKMFDDIELPTLPTQSRAPQHTPPPSNSIAAQPQFQDIGLDVDAEIGQLNKMIEAKEGTPHEGYLINPSLIENSQSGAEAPTKPTVMAKTEGPKGKEEASDQHEDLSQDDLGDDSEDDPVVLQSPGSFSEGIAETSQKAKIETDKPKEKDAVSQSGVTKVEIQGGKDSAPKSVKNLEAKVKELKGCKNFEERSNLLHQLQPGERQQVKQFISGNIMLLNQQIPGSKVENKELLKQQINELKTLETQVALSIAVPEKIPKTSIERAELAGNQNDLHMNDAVHYICDPCLYATCKNETFSKFRENGISNEALMNRFVLSYCGFAKTENVVAAIIEKFAQASDNPSAQKNLLALLSKVLASSSQSVNESPEAKAKVNEMVENFTKAQSEKTEAKGALQTQLQLLSKQTKQSVPASELAESPQENGLTLEQILAPGKKSPQMIAEFASSLTSIQNRTYQLITPSEFFTTVGVVKSKAQPNISESVKLFNNITNVAVQAILQESSKDRMEMIKFFIDLQNQLIKNGDFQSGYALQAALNNAAVDRLDEMKSPSLGKYAEALEKNSKLFSPSKNFTNLTAEIRERKSKGEFYLPLISLALMQLTNAHEMPDPQDKNMVSPYKILQFGAVIETACESQSDKNKGMNPPKHNVRDALLNVNINPDDMYDRSLALQPRK